MAGPCTYHFTDENGNEVSLKGLAAFQAYLAEGGLEHLFPKRNFPWSTGELPERILVDGKERWTVNSDGKPIANSEKAVRNFWRWFSPSPRQLLEGLSVSEVSSLKRNSEVLADFIESQSRLPESDRFKVVPPSVFSHVAGVVNNAKVLNAVVRSLPVDVMDFFTNKQLSAEQVLHDATMLEYVFSANPASDVALSIDPSSIAELAVRVVANAGAKISGLTNGALERNSAVLADVNDPVLGAHVRKSSGGDMGIIAGFGDSKVIDDQGRPLVVYHGTDRSFDAFKEGVSYFTPRWDYGYIRKSPIVVPAYLRIANPYRPETQSEIEQLRSDPERVAELESQGYDGMLWAKESDIMRGASGWGDDLPQIAVFNPNQIKSAIGNSGAFSPETNDIRYSKPEAKKPSLLISEADAKRHLLDNFGVGINNLIDNGVLRFTNGKEAWPEAARKAARGDEEAVYINGKAYIDLASTGRERLNAVVLHELGEHYSLRRMLGDNAYRALQQQIANRAKIAGSRAEKVWNEVKRNYDHLEEGGESFVSEVIAKLGELDPKAPWYRRLLSQIKSFLMQHGLARGIVAGTITESDLHTLLRASLDSAARGFEKDEPRLFGLEMAYSVADRSERPVMLGFLEEFAKDDEIFGYPVSDKKDLAGVMREVAPMFKYRPELNAYVTEAKEAPTKVFKTESGKPTYVVEGGGKVWIDVSSLRPGDRGGAFYAAVGNYAYNNGLEFIDDPAGVSREAVLRRPQHMLSLALKFGTTDFLGVSRNFEEQSKKHGLPLLNWGTDSDRNLVHLIIRNVTPVYQALPGLLDIKYDFETKRFRRITDGRALQDVWAKRISVDEAARRNNIGEATIRRAVFLQSLASSSREEKSRLLEELGATGRLAGGVPLKAAFSRPEELPEKITIDGKERHTTNSEGRQIHPTEQGVRNFWKWFADSAVVDEQGRPQVMYHGTTKDFTSFDVGEAGQKDTGWYGTGFYFTPDTLTASAYADYDQEATGQNVIPVYLKIENPFEWESDVVPMKTKEQSDGFRRLMLKMGVDGVFAENKYADPKFAKRYEVVAFNPEQIKSATGNIGDFSGESNDIRFSRPGSRKQTLEEVKDRMSLYATKIKEDNGPSEHWLKSKIEYVKNKGRDNFGVPYMSTTTAYFEGNKPVLVPVARLKRLRGMRDEQNNVRTGDLEWLRNNFRETGRLPLVHGKEYAPYIEIGYDGVPWVNEGNHRIMAADMEGIAAIPVEIVYKDGGQRAALDHWKPENILKWQDEVFNAKLAQIKNEEPRFSRLGDKIDKLNRTPEGDNTWLGDVIDTLDKAADTVFRKRLAFLSVKQIIEVAKHYMPGLNEYESLMQSREALISGWLRKADRLVSETWRELPKPIQRQLAGVMHESTLEDVHAGLDWLGVREVFDKEGPQGFEAYTQYNLAPSYKAELLRKAEEAGATILDGKAIFRSESQARNFLPEIEQSEATLKKFRQKNFPEIFAKEEARENEYRRLAKLYKALPEQAQKVYTEATVMHDDLFKDRLEELQNRIVSAVENGQKQKALLAQIREKFESQSINWYYAPLARYGSYWFYGEDASGERWFRTFETKRQWERGKKEFQGKLLGEGRNLDNLELLEGEQVSDSFIKSVQSQITETVADKDTRDLLQDQIYQMFLQTLPDISVRHSSMHRKGTKGYTEDAMRAYSSAMHHGATQLGNMKYGRDMRQVLTNHNEAKAVASGKERRDAYQAIIDAAEMLQRDWKGKVEKGVLESELDEAKEAEDEDQVRVLNEAIKIRDRLGADHPSPNGPLDYIIEEKQKILGIASSIPMSKLTKASDVLDELVLAYDHMVKYNSTDMDRVASMLNQMNFVNMLGFGLSSGIVNMIQTPGVAMPVAVGRHGSKTVPAFNKAFMQFMKTVASGKRDVDGNASITEELRTELEAAKSANNSAKIVELEDEIRMLEGFKDDGTISRTQTFDIIGVGREGASYGGRMQEFSKWAGWMFHHGERLNREVTLTAAYRLEKARLMGEGKSAKMAHLDAIEYARYVNNRAHLDYSSENAARIFRGPLSRIALQFKKYQQGMLFLWGKSLADAIGKIDEAEFEHGADGKLTTNGRGLFEAAKRNRQEARRTFMALVFMQGSLAGALSMPTMGAISALYGMLGAMIGDDDEPWDLEKDLRLGLAKYLGDVPAEIAAKGFVNTLTSVNLASRLDQADIFFKEPLKEMEGRDAATAYLAEVLGPTGGTVAKVWQGMSYLADGYWMRGAESMTPKFVGDIVKAARFAEEGAKTLDNMPLKDMSAMESFMQGLGFGSSALERRYAERGFAKEREAAIKDTRTKIMREAAWAKIKGEPVDMAAIRAWNLKHPEKKILAENISASMKGIKQSVKLREEKGYSVDPKLEYLYEENEVME